MKSVNQKAFEKLLTDSIFRVAEGKSTAELKKCHWFTWDGPDGPANCGSKRKAA